MYGEDEYQISRRQVMKLTESIDMLLDGGLLHVVQGPSSTERKYQRKKGSVSRSSVRGSRSGGQTQRVRRAMNRLKTK